MWSIGIRSGIITVLALVAYGLLVQTFNLQTSVWGNWEYIIFALGIYSGHYFYKQANKGYMTYGQAVQVGSMVAAFTGIISGVASYLVSQFVDPGFINRLLITIRVIFQQQNQEEQYIRWLDWLETNLNPISFGILVGGSMCLTGLILNLVVAIFTKSNQPTESTDVS